MKRIVNSYLRYFAPITFVYLLTATGGLILINLLAYAAPPPTNRWLLLETQWGLPEIVRFFQEATMALIYFTLFAKSRLREPVYGLLGLLFTYILFDDQFEIREKFGAALQLMPGVSTVGEAAIILIVMGIFGSLIAAFATLSRNPRVRTVALVVAACLCLYYFFSVIFDAINYYITVVYVPALIDAYTPKLMLEIIFDVLEEGGEHLAINLMTALAVGLYWLSDVWSRPQAEARFFGADAGGTGVMVCDVRQTGALKHWRLPARVMRWLTARDFLFNYRRITLIKALAPLLLPDDQLIEYDKLLMVRLSPKSLANIAEIRIQTQQTLARHNLTLHTATAQIPADGETLEALANTARQWLA